jgi:hypothetical protein
LIFPARGGIEARCGVRIFRSNIAQNQIKLGEREF